MIWLNHMLMGFKPYMGMETIVIAMIPNYGKVGFVLDNAYQLVPLMHLGFRGNPSLGFGSRWTCHSLGVWGLVFGSAQGKMEATSMALKVSFVWLFMSTIHFFLWLLSFPYFSSTLFWCVCR